MLKVDEIRRSLDGFSPKQHTQPGAWAAVAIILRQQLQGSEVLLIRRPEHPSDPWSGHMALPGGRKNSTDRDLEHTARRETLEEIGIDLSSHAELIGAIDDVHARAKGKPVPLSIRPFVYELKVQSALRPNAQEVAESLWAPLDALRNGDLDTIHRYVFATGEIELPGYNVDGRVVWGLTHQMLASLFSRLR